MFVFLFISTYICGLYANFYNADKEIYPNETLVFINIVNEDNEQFSLTVRNITKEKGLRISIEEPKNDVNTNSLSSSQSEFDTLGDKIDDQPFKRKFTKKGTYTIMIANTSPKIQLFNLNCFTSTKIPEQDKGIETLRNTLQALSNAMDTLRTENYYYNTQQEKNIKEAKSIKRLVNLLILFPIITIVIGWAKHTIIQQTIKPQKKKFKKVF